MKRTGVRTHTLGAGWEERFLAAVRKARAQKLLPEPEAEKLRRLAGAYFCAKCKLEHRTESALGKKHLRLQPKAEAAPVAAAEAAKKEGTRARAKVAKEPGAKPKVQRTLEGGTAEAPKAAKRPRGRSGRFDAYHDPSAPMGVPAAAPAATSSSGPVTTWYWPTGP